MLFWGCLDFLLVPECPIPGKIIHYIIRYGVEVRALKIVRIQSAQPRGPRCNMDLTCYIWYTFDYYCANYAVILLPSQNSGDKIVYVRSYQAAIGVRLLGFVGSKYALLGNLARVIISAVLNLKRVRAPFVVKHTLL